MKKSWRVVALGGALAAVCSQAGAVSSPYLIVEPGAAVPSTNPLPFPQLAIESSEIQWDCASGACQLAGAPSVSAVLKTADGQPLPIQSLSFSFNLMLQPQLSETVIDPLGQAWRIGADIGKWSVGVHIVSNERPADAQFATAYGQFTRGLGGFLPTPPSLVARSVNLLSETGWLNLESRDPRFSLMDVEPGLSWDVYGQLTLTSPNYALPSITDPRCSSLSCMQFKPGTLWVDAYRLQLGLTAVAVPVPEPSTLLMAVLGLAGIGVLHRRR